MAEPEIIMVNFYFFGKFLSLLRIFIFFIVLLHILESISSSYFLISLWYIIGSWKSRPLERTKLFPFTVVT